MDPISIITGLATVVPSIVRWIGGDKAGEVADKAVGIAQALTGDSDPAAALEKIKVNSEYQLQFQRAWVEAEVGFQQELTKRHEADMASDSWLSKNVRPLVLLGLTTAIVVGLYMPSVSEEKYGMLCDLGMWVYGYYFVGRSTFDKGNVKFDWRRASSGGN